MSNILWYSIWNSFVYVRRGNCRANKNIVICLEFCTLLKILKFRSFVQQKWKMEKVFNIDFNYIVCNYPKIWFIPSLPHLRTINKSVFNVQLSTYKYVGLFHCYASIVETSFQKHVKSILKCNCLFMFSFIPNAAPKFHHDRIISLQKI